MIFYRERILAKAPASSFEIQSKKVKYGYVRKIERVIVQNSTGDRGAISIYLTNYGYKHYVDTTVNLTSKPTAPSQVGYMLREDEGLGFEITGVNVGDEIQITITGYEEKR